MFAICTSNGKEGEEQLLEELNRTKRDLSYILEERLFKVYFPYGQPRLYSVMLMLLIF